MRLSVPMGCNHCAASITDCFTLCQLGAKYHEKTSIICDKLLSVLCFFICLFAIIHHCRSGFDLASALAKKGAYMIASVMVSRCHHIVMSGVVRFCVGLSIGFGLGVYFLPIFTTEKGPDIASIAALSLRRCFAAFLSGICRGQLDCFEVIMLNADRISLDGKVAPRPDYRLYLTPKYVETGCGIQTITAQSLQIGPIKAFESLFHSINQIE